MATTESPSGIVVSSPLERLRQRQMRDAAKLARLHPPKQEVKEKEISPLPVDFKDLGLDPELMIAVNELGLSQPTEVQALGIPAVVAGESVVLASHTGSGKTLAYMLPIVQVSFLFSGCFQIFFSRKNSTRECTEIQCISAMIIELNLVVF